MLSELNIQNIAVIESADISFEPGFNVLSGETGAGKSIIVDALSAVLGERTSRELIRTGADSARVSAVFTGLPSEVDDLLKDMDLEPTDGESSSSPGPSSRRGGTSAASAGRPRRSPC